MEIKICHEKYFRIIFNYDYNPATKKKKSVIKIIFNMGFKIKWSELQSQTT